MKYTENGSGAVVEAEFLEEPWTFERDSATHEVEGNSWKLTYEDGHVAAAAHSSFAEHFTAAGE